MKNETGVILTGGDFQGLDALRAFSQRNIPVVIVDNTLCISRYSRCKHRFFHAPSPSNPEAYIQFLIELAGRENLQDWIVIPNSDEIVYLLSTHRDLLQKYYHVYYIYGIKDINVLLLHTEVHLLNQFLELDST